MDEHKLICLVQEKDYLYNKASKHFKDPAKKKAAWILIAAELGSLPETCERRWTSLRERYSRTVRQMECPSGSGAKSADNWIHFESMSFLRGHLLKRKQRTSYLSSASLVSAAPGPMSQSSETLSPALDTDSPLFDIIYEDNDDSFQNAATEVASITNNVSMLSSREPSRMTSTPISTPEPTTSQAQSRAKKQKTAELTEMLGQVNQTFNSYVQNVLNKQEDKVDKVASGFTTTAYGILCEMNSRKKMKTIMKLMEVLQDAQLDSDEDL